MGYRSSVTGEMIFSRSLTRSEAARMDAALNDEWSVWKLTEEVTEESDEEEGTTTIRRRFTGLELRYDDEVKTIGYDWDRTLQKIIDQLPGLPNLVTVTGMFEAIGEQRGDGYEAERLYVTHPERRVVTVKPVVSWPDTPEGARA